MRIFFSVILFLFTSCVENKSNVRKNVDLSDNKELYFSTYIEHFVTSREQYNNNSQTRDKFEIELRDSLMLLKGDTLYNITLKFNDLGPTVDGIRSIGFKYQHLLPNYKMVRGRFSGDLPISEIDKLVENSEYKITAIFDGFIEDARTKGKLHMTPKIDYDETINLGVMPITIISIEKK